MAATLSEIDSFTAKFKALMMKGVKVTLTVEAIEGEAFITLKAGLGLKCLSKVHENPQYSLCTSNLEVLPISVGRQRESWRGNML